MRIKINILLLITVLGFKAQAQKAPEEIWVDSIYNMLTPDERIGQLFMIRAHSDRGPAFEAQVDSIVKKYQVGGLCFFQGTPELEVELTNRYQASAKIPLFVSMDAEWGVAMRMKESAIMYPKQLMLGAIQDNSLIYQYGVQVATECKRMGLNINFAPDADVNNNPKNPVINERSFGENKYNVAAKAFQYMRAMQDNGVMACGKHFPGHGDTDVDSHYDLPVISHKMDRLDNIEMFPFRVLIQHGIMSLMVAHLQVPAIDSTKNLPTSLSKNAIIDLLRQKMGYDGLVFTDGLEMKGVTKYYEKGDVSAKSLQAGNDIMLLPENIGDAIQSVKAYIAQGKIPVAQVEASVRRVLRGKYQLGLTTPQKTVLANVRRDINTPSALALKKKLIEAALTLVRSKDSLVPFRQYNADDIATLSIGAKELSPFQLMTSNYGIKNHYFVGAEITEQKRAELLLSLKNKPYILVGLHDMDASAAKDFGLTASEKAFIKDLAKQNKIILTVFGNPYSLKYFDSIPVLLAAYNNDKMTQAAAAQAIFGALPLSGKLPITTSEGAKEGMGMKIAKLGRLQYGSIPESVGFDSQILNRIDSLANDLIEKGVAPGCQILVAKDGQIVYDKAFGYHTYEKLHQVTTADLYDLASITKICATTFSLMKLFDQKKLDVYKPLSEYVPYLKGTNKESLIIRDILIHQAGLKEWIPFYQQTMLGKSVDTKYYATESKGLFTLPVANNLYLRADYADSIKQAIANSPLRENNNYKYSDLGMIMMADLVKNVSGKTLDQFAKDSIYTPLHLKSTLFNPLDRFPLNAIAPTEEDRYFRNQRLQGYVHDMGAAMLGGVSGHAGLFSNTHDLAILFQTLLNRGEYGGQQIFSKETVRFFTTRQGGSTRRGLGFDLKEQDEKLILNMSSKAAATTFGHTGFTGNAIYADPDNKIIYIFLSNRTYPTMDNNKLSDGNYRPKIQTVIYDALK
jgi:beta-N-acetylhexosaminidase